MIHQRFLINATAAVVGSVAVTALPVLAATAVPQIRHLVYSFTWGTSNNTEVHTSGIGATGNSMGAGGSGSGMASSTGAASDHGTITIDVLRRQPDNGLVLNVSEQAIERRSAPAATCVVYGDLTVVCDPEKKINSEELTLLRLLGSNFVDPGALDAKKHWQHQHQSGTSSSTTDFTISKNDNGIMTISESRAEKDATGARPQTSDITATIGYDFARLIPTSIDEYTIIRSDQGDQYQTVKSQTELRLQSDSSAPKT
jgi:hypothetical protein